MIDKNVGISDVKLKNIYHTVIKTIAVKIAVSAT